MKLIRPCVLATALLLPVPGLAQDAAKPLPPAAGEVILTVAGQLPTTHPGEEIPLDRAFLDTLPHRELVTSTSVTDGKHHFEGFLMRDLLERLGTGGDTAVAIALNDYIVEIPVRDFHDYDVVVATHMDGQQLTRRDKGPLWIVYPRDDHTELQDIRYDYRWVWQLRRLEIQ
ncbi:MAG: hypothetical protein RI841_13720 [Halomonas sp.]|uniref:molybdopterin-dependent oxidoreductase n=1 Tax=Halomonas sp. TaxID=1486246 RepID=UPI0028701593|nr:molybdopterin-dependent oxidoreductase [Halomonas sp.]MDR9440532.1 hypothetical protein [Halomonas sp.]